MSDRPIWHILTGEYPPQRGGVSDYTRLVARGLAAEGDSVEVWTAAGVGTDDDVTVHRLPGGFGPRGLARLSRALNRTAAAHRLLVQYVPQAFGWRGGNVPFCAWLRARRRDPIWVMFHEVMFVSEPGSSAGQRALGAVTRVMASLAAGAAERAFVSIPQWQPLIDPMIRPGTPVVWLPVPSSVPVAGNAERTEAVRARHGGGEPIVGHFGTFGGLIEPLLERALAALAARSTSRILLIGDASDAAMPAIVAAVPALAGRVAATGRLGAADLSAHLAACDVMLQPYPDGVSSRRTSVMAALAHGRAVATTSGWLTEPVWGERGAVALVPYDDPEALGAAAGALAADPGARRALGARAAALYDERFALRHTLAALRN